MRSIFGSFILSVLVNLNFLSCQAQESFQGETLLTDCLVDIPLTYKTIDAPKYQEAAIKYQGQELIRLSFSEESDMVMFYRCYIVSEKDSIGTLIYLTSKKDFESPDSNIVKLLSAFNSQRERFYMAECFDLIIANNTRLKKWLFEKDFF